MALFTDTDFVNHTSDAPVGQSFIIDNGDDPLKKSDGVTQTVCSSLILALNTLLFMNSRS